MTDSFDEELSVGFNQAVNELKKGLFHKDAVRVQRCIVTLSDEERMLSLVPKENVHINMTDRDEGETQGWTPLTWAAYKARPDVVEILLDAGVKTEKSNADGNNAVIVAAVAGHADVLRVLIQSNQFDINSKNENNHRILPLIESVRNGHEDCVRVLLENKAEVDSSDDVGSTPLMIVAQQGFEDILRVLIEYGADVDAQNVIGVSAAMLASQGGHVACLKILGDCGANFDLLDREGHFAWEYAALSNQVAVMEYLPRPEKIDPRLQMMLELREIDIQPDI